MDIYYDSYSGLLYALAADLRSGDPRYKGKVMLRFILMTLERIRHYFARPSWFSEIGSGLATLGWGLLVINTDNEACWPSVTVLFEISKTPLWGVFAIILGVGQLFLFQIIDRRWNRPWFGACAAILVAWLWGAITIGTASAYPWPPMMSASFAWWVVNVYLSARIFQSRDWKEQWVRC